MTYTATYSPDDNKLRLYPPQRLTEEEYRKVHAAGFRWAGKQELFVAPMWTPAREDLLIAFAGAIDDEDKSLVERAQERAERFEDYSAARSADAAHAHAAVAAICDNIPLGQPILIGHHSEKHARRDQEKINSGMRRTIKFSDQAEYWAERAAGAVAAAKYKELPQVRARRIKKLESELRKVMKSSKEGAAFCALWRKVLAPAASKMPDGRPATPRDIALYVANRSHISRAFPLADFPRDPPASQYEGDMSLWSALDGHVIGPEQAAAIAIAAHERGSAHRARWVAHYESRLVYERAMLAADGGTAADRVLPEKGGACQCWVSARMGWCYIARVNKVTVTVEDNYNNGGRNFPVKVAFDKLAKLMSKAEVEAARAGGDLVEAPDKTGFALLSERGLPPRPAASVPKADPAIAAMRDLLKEGGVKTVVAPQLFPTPRPLAARAVELAAIKPGDKVLEPSGGTGALLDPLFNADGTAWQLGAGGRLVVVEQNLMLAQHLRRTYVAADVHGGDFLACNGELGAFDVVLMNPPFHNGDDIKHIRHALGMLKPGGRLVAFCANGPRQRAQLMPLASHWEDLPPGSFHEAGTNVNTALIVICG